MSDYLKDRRAVDPALTSIAHGYESTTFIGERIFLVALMDKEGIRVPTFGGTAFMGYDTGRAVGTDSNVPVREKTGTLDLVLSEHDLAAPVDYRGQAESISNEESKAIRRATNGVNLRRELITTRLTQGEKIYHTGHVKKLTASDRWADDRRDPIRVIETGVEAVRTATELCPDLMTMRAGVTVLLKFHPAIQAAIGVNERKRITTETLQGLFQIEETVIGAPVSLPPMKAAMDKNNVPANIWGGNLMLHYVGKPQPGVDSVDENEPSFSYILRRKGTPIAGKYGGTGGKVKHCRYTDIYKVVIIGGDAKYLTTGISK